MGAKRVMIYPALSWRRQPSPLATPTVEEQPCVVVNYADIHSTERGPKIMIILACGHRHALGDGNKCDTSDLGRIFRNSS